MRSRVTTQSHLEYRPSGFHWRRRWPQRVLTFQDPPKKVSLLFSLRSHVLRDAKALAWRLTLLSDIAFAGATERTMAIAPDIMERLLVELCRFLIEAADLAREVAPMRSPDVAAYEADCASAAMDTLRQAIAMRDRDVAREPLRHVADRLGLALDEDDPDWQRLAFRALRIMLEAQEENARRDRGDFQNPSPALQTALSLADGGRSSDNVQAARASLRPAHPHGRAPAVPSIAPTPLSQGSVESSVAPGPEPISPSLFARRSHTEPATADPAAAPVRSNSPVVDESDPCPIITEAMESYIDLRSKGYRTFKTTEQANAAAGKSWARNTAPNVRSTGGLFARILGDKPFDQITESELRAAWDVVARLPRSYQAKTSKKSPREAADEADATERHNAEITRARLAKMGKSPGKIESEILKGRIPRLRAATIYRHMQDFQRICVFLVKTGHLAQNLMADHIWETSEYDRREILQEDNERQTWCGKLDGLFRTSIYQTELEDVGDPLFWAPLIAVHMGLRSEEILQLYVDDIQVIDGVPCIVLRQGPGQSLKSQASRRTVPIHDNLLNLGLLQLVAMRKRDDEPRLFPWIERSQAKKTYTETFSKRFTRYRQDHGIYDVQRDFHSFRTTFNHLLIEAECPDTQRRVLVGHVERDVGITNYKPGGFSKALLRKRVDSVVIDISMIRSPFGDRADNRVARLSDHRPKLSV